MGNREGGDWRGGEMRGGNKEDMGKPLLLGQCIFEMHHKKENMYFSSFPYVCMYACVYVYSCVWVQMSVGTYGYVHAGSKIDVNHPRSLLYCIY